MDEKYIICLLVVCLLAGIVIALAMMVNDRGKALIQCREQLKQLQENKNQHDV